MTSSPASTAREGENPKICIEMVIGGLDERHTARFRANLEFWRNVDRRLLGPSEGSAAGQPGVEPAVRIRYVGAYDPESD